MRDAITSYRPHRLTDEEWQALAPLTRRLVAGYRPTSTTNAKSSSSAGVRIATSRVALPRSRSVASRSLGDRVCSVMVHRL